MTRDHLLRRLEIRVQFINQLAIRRLQYAIDYVDDQIFQTIKEIGEIDEGAFGLHVGILGNMSPCS